MPGSGGRFEATITVDSPGVDITADDGAGPYVVNIPAGDYYVGDLLTLIESELNDGGSGTWTLTRDWGERGDGSLTLDNTNTFSINWGSLASYFGFQNATSSIVPLESLGAAGVWIPGCVKSYRYEDNQFDTFTDLRQTIGPTGRVKTLIGNRYRSVDGLSWSHVTYQSMLYFKDWWSVLLGYTSAIQPGKPVKYYWDADDDNSSGEYVLILNPNDQFNPAVNGWTGLYRIEMPRMIEYLAP